MTQEESNSTICDYTHTTKGGDCMDTVIGRDKSVTNTSERYFYILFLFVFADKSIIGWTMTVLQLILKSAGVPLLADVIYVVGLFFLIINSYKYLCSNLRIADVMFFFFAVLCYVVSLIDDGNYSYISLTFSPFFKAIFLYYIGICLEIDVNIRFMGRERRLEDLMLVISAIGIIVMVMYQFYFVFTKGALPNEVSSWSTDNLIYVLFVVIYAFRNKHLFSVILGAVGLIALLSYGIRANVLSIFVAISVCIIRRLSKSRYKIIGIIILFIITVGIYTYFDSILSILEIIFVRFGFSTRILALVNNSDILHTSSRELFYQRAISLINERWLTGYGIFGDRPIFGGMGEYVHNFFLEILFDFGLVMGSIMLILIVGQMIFAYFRCRNNNLLVDFFLLLLCREMVMLMFSGSYLVEGYFFMLLGFVVRINRKRKMLRV